MDPEYRKPKFDLAQWGGGLGPGCTTVMIRHVPYEYPPKKLVQDIDSAGFSGFYDFFYMPSAKRRCSNRGFAFINFVHHEIAESFYKSFYGRRLTNAPSDKPLAVLLADVQGFEANAEYYGEGNLKSRGMLQYMPVFLRPLPAKLVRERTTERTFRL